MSKRTAEERFWAKVQKTDGCWLWTASLDPAGYGQFWDGRHMTKAHRYAYELLVGPIPEDQPELDHRTTCPKRCANPDHLRPATKKQNGENRAGANRNSGTGVRGVSWCRRTGRFQVGVKHHGKRYFGGRYDDIASAEQAAIRLRAKFFTYSDSTPLGSFDVLEEL